MAEKQESGIGEKETATVHTSPHEEVTFQEQQEMAQPSPCTEKTTVQECVPPSFTASHVRLPLEERSGGEMELPASAASQSLEAAPRGMETAPRGLETAPPQSSQACSGGPSLDSTAEDLNNMSLDGDTPILQRQDTNTSAASSSSSSGLSISMQMGVNPSFQYKLEGSHEGETVRKCSADAVAMIQHITAMRTDIAKSSASLSTVDESSPSFIPNLEINTKTTKNGKN